MRSLCLQMVSAWDNYIHIKSLGRKYRHKRTEISTISWYMIFSDRLCLLAASRGVAPLRAVFLTLLVAKFAWLL